MLDIVEIPVVKRTLYSIYIKRVLDILISLISLLILSPLFIIICILELIYHGKPIFYSTIRPGKDGKLFKLYKFRSMTNNRDEEGKLLPEETRLTKFGIFLRRTSIDELPELFSILKGDMSIIGPRPLLVEYLKLYTPRHAMRHAVRPGLACTPITKQKQARTWRSQFENDIYYIENVSFILDLKTLIATAKAALIGSDDRTNDTRIPFDGTNLDETRNKNEVELSRRFERAKISESDY